MRKVLFIAAMAFIALFTTNSAHANTYLPTTPALSENPLRITITINFGQRSKGCTGFGVCSIVISAELSARPSNNSGSGVADNKDGKLVVTLNKSSMTREALAKYFPNGKFVVEEDVQVAEAIAAPRDVATGQATGKRQHKPYNISKGVYNVQDNGSTVTIVF